MKQLISICFFISLLAGCGPSEEEKKNVATIACNVMSASRDWAFRIKEMNAAREKVRGPPFLGTGADIAEALRWELCEELVFDDGESYALALAEKLPLSGIWQPDEKMMYGAKESGKLYFSKDSEGNWLFEERVLPESELVQILKENEGKRVLYRPQMWHDSINWSIDTDLLMVKAGRWDKIMLDRSGKKESDLSFFEKRKWVDID